MTYLPLANRIPDFDHEETRLGATSASICDKREENIAVYRLHPAVRANAKPQIGNPNRTGLILLISFFLHFRVTRNLGTWENFPSG